MTTLLLQQLPSDFSAIQKIDEIQDWEQLKFLVHKLHGALCYCNVHKARAAAKELAMALRKNEEVSEITKLYDMFCVEITTIFESNRIKV